MKRLQIQSTYLFHPLFHFKEGLRQSRGEGCEWFRSSSFHYKESRVDWDLILNNEISVIYSIDANEVHLVRVLRRCPFIQFLKFIF